MATATERLLVRIDATTEQLRRELKRADQALGQASGKIDTRLKKIDKSFERLGRSLKTVNAAIGAIGFGLVVREVIQASDAMAKMRGQLRLVTNSQEELNTVYQRALSLSNKVGQATDTTVNLYSRLARATGELNLSQDELFRITETISKAMAASGASAEESGRAIIQLSQALAGGVLRAEEFNSINEQTPLLLEKMAQSLGVTRGELRQMVVDGEITTEKMVKAFADMAESVDRDFNKLPMTIGRVMQTVTNDINDALGQVDASPLIGAIEELRSVLSDPATKQAIQDIAQALILVVTNATKAVAAVATFFRDIGEGAAKLMGFTTILDDIAAKEQELARLEGQRTRNNASRERQEERVAQLREEIARLKKQYDFLIPSQEKSTKATEDSADAGLEEVKVLAKRWKASKEYVKYLEQERKAKERLKDANADYIADLEFEVSLLGKSEREQGALTAVRRLNAEATEEQKQKVKQLAEALYDAEEASKGVKEETENITRAQGPFQQALQDTAARIDEAFAGAWKGAFDSFDSFADRLKDAFKNLLGELANLAITRPIVMSFTGGTALGGSSSAMAGIGSAISGGPAGILSGVGTALSGGLTALGSPVAQFFGSMAGGSGVLGQIGFQASGALTGLGGLFGGGAALGAGILTGGAGLLGLAALSGAFESNNGRNSGIATLDLATGAMSSRGVGKSFDPKNVEAAQAYVEFFSQFSQALGGSSGDLEVKIGNRNLFRLNGEKFGNEADLIRAGIETIVDNAGKLTEQLKKLIKGFDGSTEELVMFSQAVISISEMMKINPVTKATEEYQKAQERAAKGLMAAYTDQTSALKDMIANFDGSAEAAAALNEALVANKQLAYDLTIAFKQVADQVFQTTRANINYFRQQTSTEEQQIKFLENQQKFWTDALLSGNITDPTQILQIAQGLSANNRALFDLGPADGQNLNVDTFINFERWLNNQVQRLTGMSISDLSSSQGDINASVGTALDNAAAVLDGSAEKMMGAAELFWEAVNRFAGMGSNVGVEVVA